MVAGYVRMTGIQDAAAQRCREHGQRHKATLPALSNNNVCSCTASLNILHHTRRGGSRYTRGVCGVLPPIN